jgi:hypothetical protein
VLGDGHKLFATLTWPSGFSNQEVGEWSPSRMVIETKGIVHNVVTVTSETFKEEIARIPWTWRSESLVDFADGQSYLIKRHGFWNGRWTISQEDGTVFLELRLRATWRDEAPLKIDHIERLQSHLPVLVILLWYTYMLAQHEGVAAATAGGA